MAKSAPSPDRVGLADAMALPVSAFYANGVASQSLGLPAGAQRTPATPGHGRPDEFYPNGVASVAGTAPGSGVVLVTQPRWATL